MAQRSITSATRSKELWTPERIAAVTERLTGVRYHPAWAWALLRHRLGWSVQRPRRRAAGRDRAAIDRWVKERWPAINQTANGAEPAWSSRCDIRRQPGTPLVAALHDRAPRPACRRQRPTPHWRMPELQASG